MTLLSGAVCAGEPAPQKPTILTLVPEYIEHVTANFNPFAKSPMPTTHEFIFEPLVIFNSFQHNKPVYRLATDYQLDEDLKGITFTLRQGVRWSDGKPFTAEDVVFSLSLVQKYPNLDSHGITQWVHSVQQVNNNQVYVKLTQPNALIAYSLVLNPIVPKHQWESVENPATFQNAQPIGTGPFTQISQLTEDGYIQCRNPHYWQAKQLHVDCLRYPKITNNDDFIARVATGEFDWAGSFIPDIERHYASYSPDYNYWLPPASTINLLFNFKTANPEIRALFQQRSFRRAISMAVQRQLLIDIAAFGQGVPSEFASGMSQRFEHWADPVTKEKYRPYMTYNPALARERLDTLGVHDHDQDGWRELSSGQPLSLTILTPKGWSDFNTTALLLTEMLADIGIQAQTLQVEFYQFAERMAQADYTLALTNYPDGLTPFNYFKLGFDSAYQAPQYPRYAMHFYRDPRIDTLLEQFPTAATAHQRLSIIRDLDRLVASQQITVPLYNTVQFYQYNTQRFTGWFDEDNPVANPVVWPQNPERLLHVLALRPKLP
ncbi:ABC transporter substrate-binding protein [Photobacterium atrarenae]|uniref:ABC transporter substrate-binding protein n=1 Tax=Photobacterium atrarenae TaxID=865757 RepID=A0ABY5GGI0_9GAMM|nr:ABC transporter substrate-binding protein [Photobacterium atrarenae]UTV28402.1 ABC transporter substrate-binding protein [Photobacterium atrarenae]